MKQTSAAVGTLLSQHRDQVLAEWQAELGETGTRGGTTAETSPLLEGLIAALKSDAGSSNLDSPAWSAVRDTLGHISRNRAAQGSTAADTSRFVQALKKPIFSVLQRSLGADPAGLLDTVWDVSTLLDTMAQFTVTTYQRTREEIIARQQAELLELSTPVIKLWEGVLAVPMIGTLDSGRTQLVMEALLQRIVDTGSTIAIIDITGVPTVDTLVAQHLLKTVTAIRLMGAECIISGIRPQIAQTIVHLGIDLQGILTRATLADALAIAMKRSGFVVARAKAATTGAAAS